MPVTLWPQEPSEPSFFETPFLGNTLAAWGIAIAATVGALLVLSTVRRLLTTRAGAYLSTRSHRSAAFVGRLLQRTSVLLVVVLSAWFGSGFLYLPPVAVTAIRVAVVLAMAIQVISWAVEALEFGLFEFQRRRHDQHGADDPAIATAAPAIRFIGRLIVVVVVVLLALQNLGVDVTALVAGLGVGGIAIALAVQNILGDLFASLSIVLDKPFVVGDFIVVGDRAGTVETIGLKTTRVRSLSGEQLIFANSDLLGSRIQNFKRMRERRIAFTIAVSYQTPFDLVEKLAGVLRECIVAQGKTRFERAHFKAYGSSSLDFEAVYWVTQPDHGVYMDIHQAINLAIGRRFKELGVEFAFPTQTLHIVRGARANHESPPAVGS